MPDRRPSATPPPPVAAAAGPPRGRMPDRARLAELVLENTGDFGVLTTDLDGAITSWNAGAERILGWAEAEALGRHAALIFTPEDEAADACAREMAHALSAGRAADERWHMRRDGGRFWGSGSLVRLDAEGEEGGAPVGFLKIIRDRTEQHQAGERLRAGEAMLRSVFESSGDCLKLLTPDGRLEHVNGPGLCVLEIDSLEEVRGREWASLWPEAERGRLRRALSEAAAGRVGRFQGHCPTARGTPRWWDVQVTAVPDGEGRPGRFLVSSRDVTAMQTAREALRDSEERLRHALSIRTVGMLFWGPDLRLREVNDAFLRMTGFGRAEVLGRAWQELTPPELHPVSRAALAEVAATGEAAPYETQCWRRDGSRWWGLFSLRRIAAGETVAFVVDITDRKEAEAALRDSEARLRLATDAAEIGLWDVDVVTGTLFWPPRIKAMFGIAPDAPASMADFFAGLHPEDRARVSAAYDASVDPGRRAVYDVEYRTIGRDDGVLRWVAAKGRGLFDAEGTCVRSVGTALDVTVRKRAEAALLEGERRLRELNETLERRVDEALAERKLWADVFASTDALIAALDPDGRFLALNGAYADEFERIFGVRPRAGDELGRLLAHLPAQRAALLAVWSRALSGEEFTLTQEFGDPLRARPCHELRFNVVRDGRGRAVGAFQYGVDVSERLVAQARLAEAEERLRQSQKMEAVGQLTGGLAHDFNNLLTGITGSLELLERRVAQGRLQEVGRYVEAAQGAARRAAALTHRLLAFSRRQTLAPRPTEVGRLVRGMEDMIRRTMGPGIAVEVTEAAAPRTTLVDPSQLENALLNLCINARDAMPEGGRLLIETGEGWLGEEAAREGEVPAGPYVTLRVADTGSGMAADVVARAFDPFFTTKPLGEGTGLGLSMIYGFARQSGGQVSLRSEVGRGTSVCLFLPRHLDEVETETVGGAEPRAPRAGRDETVLVVDDEPTVRMLVVEALEELGYAASEAADGAAGLRVLQGGARIDLLVTDVGLPGGLNGRQLADAGRALRPGLKVLFITGYAEAAVLGGGQLGPGMHVLTKPFAMEALASRIGALIAEG